MKKIFAISLGLFLLTLLFLGVYNFAFKNNPGNPIADKEAQKTAKTDAENEFEGKLSNAPIEPVTDTMAFGATLFNERSIAYFFGGKLRKVTLGGGVEETLVENIPGKILRAVWSADRSQVLTLLSGNGADRWHLIRISDKSITPLKNGISSPAWSNIGEKIFYFYTDPENGKTGLNTARPDGSEWKEIAKSPIDAPYIATVPGGVNISFWSRPNAFEETSLHTVAMTGGEPKRIFWGKYGANYLWAPDGTHILISSASEKGGSNIRLGVANQNGGEFQALQVPTLISKAVWANDSKTIYYALPLSMPENAVLPNDYFGKPIHTNDSFWRMDTSTGKSERIVSLEDTKNGHDSIDLFLDTKEEFLFFTDRNDGKLYRIRIQDPS